MLLVCYSVPENWRKALIRSFRESCPDGRMVGIVASGLEHPSYGFDEVISSTDKANALLEAISGERRHRKAG